MLMDASLRRMGVWRALFGDFCKRKKSAPVRTWCPDRRRPFCWGGAVLLSDEREYWLAANSRTILSSAPKKKQAPRCGACNGFVLRGLSYQAVVFWIATPDPVSRLT